MGGRPTTLWVYLVPFGRNTWEAACMPWPCLRTAVLFAEFFLSRYKTNGWAILGHIFCFSYKCIFVVDMLADKCPWPTWLNVKLPFLTQSGTLKWFSWTPHGRPTYRGSANYTMGLSGTVWSLHMGASLHALAKSANGSSFRGNFSSSRDQTDGVGTWAILGHIFS